MNKILIIIQREFLKRVKKKSFIVLTILMPFILAALVMVPLWLSTIENDEQSNIAVVDNTGHYFPVLKDTQTFHFVLMPKVLPDMKSDSSSFEAVVNITADLSKNPNAITIFSRKEVSGGLLSYVESQINEQVRKDKLAASGVPELDKIIDDIDQDISISTVKWDKEGQATSSNTEIAIGAGFIFTFLIYMFVMAYGGMVMQSVIEEKTNRIVELMVSSVKPFQLMMGKIIGIALVGFVQLIIWGIVFTIILTVATAIFGPEVTQSAAASQPMMGAASQMPMSEVSGDTVEILSALKNLPYLELMLMFVLYFIGGYLLYASFFAAVGASVNEQEDSSQFVLPVTLIMVFGLYAAMYSVNNTDGPLAFWASIFPLTSPIVMMVRIPFGVPLWQEALSIVLLYASAIGMVWVGAKIYRVGILMYGKKPSLKEMIKWLRYK